MPPARPESHAPTRTSTKCGISGRRGACTRTTAMMATRCSACGARTSSTCRTTSSTPSTPIRPTRSSSSRTGKPTGMLSLSLCLSSAVLTFVTPKEECLREKLGRRAYFNSSTLNAGDDGRYGLGAGPTDRVCSEGGYSADRIVTGGPACASCSGGSHCRMYSPYAVAGYLPAAPEIIKPQLLQLLAAGESVYPVSELQYICQLVF